MARQLAKLIGRQDDKLLLATIDDLEKVTGSKGIDVTLLGEIISRSHNVIRALNLDSRDTTARELYQALRVAHAREALELVDYLGVEVDGECISLNAHDLAEDVKKNVSFEQRTLGGMQAALAGELARRYMENATHHEKIVRRLVTVFETNQWSQ